MKIDRYIEKEFPADLYYVGLAHARPNYRNCHVFHQLPRNFTPLLDVKCSCINILYKKFAPLLFCRELALTYLSIVLANSIPTQQ